MQHRRWSTLFVREVNKLHDNLGIEPEEIYDCHMYKRKEYDCIIQF